MRILLETILMQTTQMTFLHQNQSFSHKRECLSKIFIFMKLNTLRSNVTLLPVRREKTTQ